MCGRASRGDGLSREVHAAVLAHADVVVTVQDTYCSSSAAATSVMACGRCPGGFVEPREQFYAAARARAGRGDRFQGIAIPHAGGAARPGYLRSSGAAARAAASSRPRFISISATNGCPRWKAGMTPRGHAGFRSSNYRSSKSSCSRTTPASSITSWECSRRSDSRGVSSRARPSLRGRDRPSR